MSENTPALWNVSLDVECPNCKSEWDLLISEVDLFWNDNPIKPMETNTPRTKDISIVCYACKHQFKVNLEY